MITTMTPTPENIRGTSALPYHLLKGLICPPSPLKGELQNGSQTPTLAKSPQAPLKGGVQSGSQTPPQTPPLCERGGEIPNSPFRGLGEQRGLLEQGLAGQDVDVVVYTFNNNGVSDEQMREVERELDVTIKVVPLPWWFKFVFKFHLLFIRLFLKYPIHHYIKLPQEFVQEIKDSKPDLIWVYGAEWSRVTRQFEGFQRIHTLPDSEALYYYRMLGQRFVARDWKKFWRCALMYPKFLRLERNFPTNDNIHYHLVGEEDANFLTQMNPGIQAHFIRHPHYEVAERGPIRFHRPKIRLLIAGQYNLYMQQTADEVLEWIIGTESPSPPKSPLKRGTSCSGSKTELPPLQGGLGGAASQAVHAARRVPTMPLGTPPASGGDGGGLSHYTITFLGKGWERHVEALRSMGVEVNHIKFAPDYIEEVIKHDIQVTPITIGTGTKGKVLDALANGLLVLGTPYAMENIAVEHGSSCMVWRTPQELLQVLQDIPQRIEHYEQMAEAGRQAVLEHHNREKIARKLFGLMPYGQKSNENLK